VTGVKSKEKAEWVCKRCGSKFVVNPLAGIASNHGTH
jgi:transposase-like protein